MKPKRQTAPGGGDGPPNHDPDAEKGMAWWNGLDEAERARWMKVAGDTGVAADAWSAFKAARSEHH